MTDQAPGTFLHAGTALDEASAAIILIHGRGSSAESIMGLSKMLDSGDSGIAWIAPEAATNSWYPSPFPAPIETNEPHRSDALAMMSQMIDVARGEGIDLTHIGLIGFSQGACLSLEYTLIGEHLPAFVGALSGGLMGPLDEPREIEGTRAGTHIFLGCGDQDGHIALPFAERSAKLFEEAGATVDYRVYPGMDHTINRDELNVLQDAISRLAQDRLP